MFSFELEKSGEGFDFHIRVLKAICGDTNGKSMVDLCCGRAQCTSQLGFSNRRYVDLHDCGMVPPSEQEFFVLQDVLTVEAAVDVSFCLDGIEHFNDPDAHRLLDVMERISDRQILFTPLGFLKNDEDNHPLNSHKSGWTPEKVSDYASIAVPNFHPTLGFGAFYFWKCADLEADFERVKKELT